MLTHRVTSRCLFTSEEIFSVVCILNFLALVKSSHFSLVQKQGIAGDLSFASSPENPSLYLLAQRGSSLWCTYI